MVDTQMHGMEHVRDMLDHATSPVATRSQRSDQSSSRVPSLQLHLRAAPTSNETPPVLNDSIQLRQNYTRIISKRSSDIYKVDKYYVGLLHQIPPPKEVQDKWDTDIRPNLEQHLCQATRMLSKSLRDEEVITEPVLCMAGKRCSPTSLSLESSTTSPKDPVALNPMIWIHCGSKKCRNKVNRVTSSLSYVKHFEGSFSMQPLHASIQAPWPAGTEYLASHSQNEFLHVHVSLDIQIPTSQPMRVSGAKARFTIWNGPTFIERFCTIGGLIKVEDKLYAITTAHPLLNGIKEQTASGESSAHDTTSDDDDETSSDSDSDQSGKRRPMAKQGHRSMSSMGATGKWVSLPRPTALSYLGQATSDGNYGLPHSISTVSDFALIEIKDISEVVDTEHMISILTGHILTNNLSSGEVSVIANDELMPIKGFLLDGNASIILRGEIIRTRKLQIKHPGKRGWSGSWVVRDDKLCGMIYAAYDQTPYLHMLPIEEVFQGIAELLDAHHVEVADLSKIQRVTRSAKLSEEANEVMFRSRRGRNPKLPLAALHRLQTWLDEHLNNPYPSLEEKRQLAEHCHVTVKQVTTWFTNARARQLTSLDTLLESEAEEETGDESGYDSAKWSSTYTNTTLTSLAENQPYNRRTGSGLGFSVQSGSESKRSRRGKKKDYRRAQQPPANELTASDSAGSNLMSPARSLQVNELDMATEQQMWQCTFCYRYITPKSWRRHEETQHRPRAEWTCMHDGPRISIPNRTTSNGNSACAFCMAKDPSEDHFLSSHRISECATQPTRDRTFFRPDHLRQHVKNFHGATLFDIVQAQWKKAPGGVDAAGWTCGFCAAHLDTWDRRETHIANHFKEGMTMEQWVEGVSIDHTEVKKGKRGKGHHSSASPSRSFTPKTRRAYPETRTHPFTTTFSHSFDPKSGLEKGGSRTSEVDDRVILPEITNAVDGYVDWQNSLQFQDSDMYTTTSDVPSMDFHDNLNGVLGYEGTSMDHEGPWTTQG